MALNEIEYGIEFNVNEWIRSIKLAGIKLAGTKLNWVKYGNERNIIKVNEIEWNWWKKSSGIELNGIYLNGIE